MIDRIRIQIRAVGNQLITSSALDGLASGSLTGCGKLDGWT